MIPFPFLFLHRCCGGYMGNPSNTMMVYLFSYSVLWRLIFTLSHDRGPSLSHVYLPGLRCENGKDAVNSPLF